MADFSFFEEQYQIHDVEMLENYLNNKSDSNIQIGAGGVGYSADLYSIVKTIQKEPIKKFHLEEKTNILKLNIKPGRTFMEINDDINQVFNKIYQDFVKPLDPIDIIGIVIKHDDIKDGVYIPYMQASQLTPKIIADKFDMIIQSYNLRDNEIKANHYFEVRTTVKVMPKGGSPIFRIDSNGDEMTDYLVNKKSVKKVYNDDNLCLLRAVLIAKIFIELPTWKAFKLTTPQGQKSKMFQKMVDEMVINTGINTNYECGPNEAKKIEESLQHYQIVVFKGNFKDREFVYLNNTRKFKKHIYICLHNRHYYAIKSMKAYLNCIYFCHLCKIQYQKIGDHTCSAICKMCKRLDCEEDERYKCISCNVICNNKNCFIRHSESVCEIVTKCKECDEKKLYKHVCGMNSKWCENCFKSVEIDHRCYILTENQKNEKQLKRNPRFKEPKFDGLIFFDYECYQAVDGIHVPNLIIARKCCVNCLETEKRCDLCSKAFKFYNNDDFCKWLLSNSNFIAMAHNMRGYDGVFIAQYCINNRLPNDAFPQILATPTKILQIAFRKLKIIDSFSFLTMSLEKFPSTFNFTELKKGIYPHRFNKPENNNYIGKFPEEFFFATEFFSVSKYEEWEKFYNENKDRTDFNNKQELEEYCLSDVLILEKGCLKFRKIIMNQTNGIDPFRVSITIASLCNYIYRSKYMRENSIGIIPHNGYDPNINSSNKCEKWLEYLMKKENINIRCKNNGGEKRVGKYYLDGFCAENKKYYEFWGCFWHGCDRPDCNKKINPITWNPLKNCSMSYLNFLTKKKTEKLKELLPEFDLVQIWECEYDRLCESNEDFRYFISSHKLKEPLIPRHALKGGRVNCFKLYYKCKEHEKIYYYDFTSLYPSCQKQEKYPIGHPIIIKKDFNYQPYKFNGLIKCSVVPPRGLYAPVLPCTINGKLMFVLCYSCAITQSQTSCRHCVNERAISGTWTTVELDYAIKEVGYVMRSLDEIWHWSEMGDLFSEYVNACMKEKQEASGWPLSCKTEEQKIDYIKKYYEVEGIKLDYNNIKKNSGGRIVAKLKANSQWGYLAMNTNKTRHRFVKNENALNEMLLNDMFEINKIIPCKNNSALQIYYIDKDEYHIGGLNTNVVVAAFVCSYGRLRLYKELRKLGKRVLYFDTDSIIFIASEDPLNNPKTGEFLGQFTNELDENEHIIEFVSCGAKNYAYKTNKGKSRCTIKGFTLDRVAGLKLTFESMKRIVTENQNEKIVVRQLKFSRDNKLWNVRTEEIDKQYGFIFDKRILKEDFSTLPFGY